MPHHRHPSTTTVDASEARRAFCARLEAEREQRNTSIAAIAAATKVNASLLAALERGDLSRWPKGIYRRSFFREYLVAIGLPVEPWLTEFLDLFAEGEERASRVAEPAGDGAADAVPLRLTFVDRTQGWAARLGAEDAPSVRAIRRRAIAAVIDMLAVTLVAAACAAILPVSISTAAAIVACAYFTGTTVLLGRTPALLWMRRRAWRATGRRAASPPSLPLGVLPWPARPIPIPRERARRSVWRGVLGAMMRGDGRARDLAVLRRRRVEEANRGSDEIEAIG